jgi:hypothetical protein
VRLGQPNPAGGVRAFYRHMGRRPFAGLTDVNRHRCP